MRGNNDNENSPKETDIAFALASFLLNVLIILVLCVGAWMLNSLLAQPHPSGALFRAYTMSR
jgi:hypothetical protein